MNWKKWISIAAAVCLAVTAVPMRAVAQEELLQEKMLEEIKEEIKEELKEELKEEPKEEKEELKEEKEEKEELQEQSDEKIEPQEESKEEPPEGISLLMEEENSTVVFENETADFAGAGTATNPYKIQNVDDLKKLAENVNNGKAYANTYFKLTANIDLNNEPNWTPIGKSGHPFQGTFDGDGHQITNFKVVEPNKYVGLFGYAQYAVIKNCSVTGEINGHSNGGYNQYNYVGGIVGYTGGSTQILNCSFRGNVTGASEKVGGIVGEISGGSKVSGCYVIGNIAGNNDQGVEGRNGVGGIIGINDKGTIENCVSLAESVTGGNVNRIVGRITGGKLTNNYAWSNTKVNNETVSDDNAGGLNGADLTYTNGTLSPQFSEIFGEDNSAWKFTKDGLPILKNVGGTQSIYLPSYIRGTEFQGSGNTAEDPYLIRNVNDLKLLAEKVNSGEAYANTYFKQTADIDLNNEPNWTPIGTVIVINNGKDARPFKGTFDGDGYKITNLKVTGNSNNAGLFGYTQDATIKNCNVTGEVSGSSDVGGIVGNADGKTQILSCSFRGDVTGEDSYIGGIAGSARGTIKNCYALADVTASFVDAGGIAGYAYHVTIENCYYSGNVSAGNDAGGIAGFASGSTIKNCVSLAKSVTGSENVNRILGDVSKVENVTLTSNYGYNRTKLVVYEKEDYADGKDKKDGTNVFVSAGKLMTDVQKGEVFAWTGFDKDIWYIPTEAGKLPSLQKGTYPDLPNLPSVDLTIDKTPQHFTTRNIGNGFVVKVTSEGTLNESIEFTKEYRLHDTTGEWMSAVPNTAGTYDVKITRAADGDINPFACEIPEGLVLTKKRSSSSGAATQTYTAQFDTNGGSAVDKVKTDKNGKIERPADPTKEGYIFVGWYSDSKLTKPFDFSAELTANSTLYAKWKENNEIILTIGSRKISVFGREIKNDVAPKIVNDRTMLPIRIVAESLGGTVTWNGELQRVTIQKGADVILITIGADTAYVNGTAVKLDAAAFVENGRTYLPLRFVSETLGAQVVWNEAEKTVTITK